MSLFKNTKTLPSSIQIPAFIKVFAKSLQVISPRLATWFSNKLFVTPITYPTPKRELVMEKSAQKKNITIPSIQKDIRVLSYGYSKKKVLLGHGWAGRSTQLFMIADKLLEKGYMVISFDAPAHGKSTGKTTNMIEYIETVKVINEEFGPFEAAVGHSFGAMALLNVASEKNIFKSLVSIGSADTVTGILNRFVNSLSLKPRIATKMKQGFEKKWTLKVDSFSSSVVAKKINNPTLIIHDTNDGDVPVSCAYKIRQSLKNGSILITNGLGHTKILRDTKTMNSAVAFIIKNNT